MQWLVEVCIARPVFTVMLTMAIIVVGVLGFITLGVDRFPNVDIPTITVTVNNPGAAPAQIETEITKKIEDQINTVSGIDKLNSTSSEGRSQITVQFLLSKDVDVAAQDVRDKINLIANDLPETAEEPIIQKLDLTGAPILQIAVSAALPQRELYDLADKQIGDQISNVSGVGEVTIVGGGEREIQIFLNPERMRAFSITATDVTLALQRQNQEIPGGRVAQGSTELTVRTMGRLQNVEDFKQIPVVKRDGYSVLLREIAEIKDSVKETRSLSLLNGVSAVTLQVRKQSGENTLAIANVVKERLKEIEAGLPPNVKIEAVGDQTIFIQASVNTVEEHLIVGSILACVVVFLFLWNVRMTIIAALAIPTSIIGTFALMWALGYTLNTITMLALTLMIGIVIDDAIVVLENISRFITEKGMEPMRAASEGTREVSLAVLATSFSLLAVFLPVGFMGGIVGKFMGSFGLTAASAIAISLFVSFSLTPMLSSRWIKKEKEKRQKAKFEEDLSANNDAETEDKNPPAKTEKKKRKSQFEYVSDTYVWMLRWSMNHRWVIVVTVIAVLASNVLWFSIIGFNFIPEDDESQFQVTIETVQGTTLPATATVAERIAREIRELPGVTDTLTTVGNGSDDAAVNTGSVYVKLAAIEDREETQAELLAKAREMLKNYPPELKLTATIVNSVGGGGNNSTIQYLLLGPDSNKLAEYSQQIVAKLKEVPEAIDVDTSLDAAKPELRVTVDRARAADLGVSVTDVSTALNILLTGSKATTFNAATDQYDVRVRASGVYRQRVEDLRQMSVRSDKNEIITLDQLVKIENSTSLSSIDRYNRQGQVTVYANVAPGESSSTVSTKLDQIVAGLNLDPQYKTAASGDSENLNESIYYFILGAAVSFIFMYMILASQFESYIHPFTILMTLPLAIPFGLVALIVTGQSLNLFAFLGILVLFGIVKKNAILQIDHTIGLRKKGMERGEAVIEANRDRLRPILMTTLAFIAGMIPLLVSSGSGAATNRSIGTLVAGGQAFCLLLTLLAVPVFYSIFDDLGNLPFFNKISARLRLFKQNSKRRLRPAYARVKSLFGGKTATTTSVLIVGLLSLSAVTFAQAQQKQVVEVIARNVNANNNTAESNEAKKTKKVIKIEILTTSTEDENEKNNQPAADANSGNNAAEKPETESNEANKKTNETNTPIVKIPASKIDFTRVGVQTDQPLPLSLQDAIRLALEQNNDIKQSETDVRIAEFALRRARGAYDPVFTTENYYQSAKTPSASSLQGSNSITDKGFYSATGISGKVPRFGGSFSADFSNSRTTSNSALNSLNPQYPSSLTFGYTQPLFRGLRIDETRRDIQVAKKNVSLSDAQFRERVIQTISEIETAYWNLVYAMKNLQVQESGARDAQAQFESNQRQVEQGTIAPIESIEAQNQVLTFQQNVYTAKVQVTEFENALKALILPNRENSNWTRTITPTSEMELEVPRISLPEAVASALANRPELARIKTNQEINQINTRFYKDQTKPQIDLFGDYTTQGLAGRTTTGGISIFDNSALTDRVNQLSALNNLPPLPMNVPTTNNNLNGGYFNSLGGLLSQKYPTYRVGVRINLPIGNRQAKADLGSSLAEGNKLEYQLAQQRQDVEREIRNALESVNATEQRWKLAIKARELSQTLYDSERRQLIAGTSTTYLVLERQITLVAAQAAEVQAQTDLNKTISALQRAVGTSLTNSGVTLQPIPEPK